MELLFICNYLKKRILKTKIMLVDDHVLLRDALASYLRSVEEFEIIGVASNGNESIQQLKIGTIPDLILLDLGMPKLGGYETAKYVCAEFPQIKIVILTMFDSEISFLRLLKVGVKGFLKKDIAPIELRKALKYIIDGGYYYSDKEMGRFTEILRNINDESDLLKKKMLSEIEIKFLQLTSSELTYKAIADLMQMSPRKIDHFRDHLFSKLDVKSRVGLAMFATRNGLVDL